jgi:hypothetical protein
MGWLLAVALTWTMGCGDSASEPTGGQTHFLTRCAQDAECGDALSCLCGICTRSCLEATDCGGLPAAVCAAAPDACGEAQGSDVCDAHCATDGDCRSISAAHRCVEGACRAGSTPGASSCSDPGVSGNQVLVLGDSFFGETHQITADLEALARGAGALAADDNYRDYSSVTSNALAFGGRGITAQYTSAVADAPASVVITDGGGTDLLLGSCASLTPDCSIIADAANAATDLFAQMASDGVTHLVYAFYPDYDDTELHAEMDLLRPLIANACTDSAVPCVWVDLRDTFAGHITDYIEANGVLPNAVGAEASAGTIWGAMKAECVAQ